MTEQEMRTAENVLLREREVLPGSLADLPVFLTDGCVSWDIVGEAGEVLAWVAASPICTQTGISQTAVKLSSGDKVRVFSNLFESERSLKGYIGTFLWERGYYWKKWWEEEF